MVHYFIFAPHMDIASTSHALASKSKAEMTAAVSEYVNKAVGSGTYQLTVDSFCPSVAGANAAPSCTTSSGAALLTTTRSEVLAEGWVIVISIAGVAFLGLNILVLARWRARKVTTDCA